MKYWFFFLTPVVTLSLFFITQEINPLSEIVISTETGSIRNHDFVQLNFLDGHNLKIGNGWRDEGYPDGKHIWFGGSEGINDPFEIYQKAYAPTYGYTGSTVAHVTTNAATGSACPTGSYTKGITVAVKRGADSVSDTCFVVTFTWDISTISAFATITDTLYRVDVSAGTNPSNCDIVKITNNPATATGPTLWDDVVGNISDVDYLTDQSYCVTVANDYVLDLGTDADSAVQDNLDDSWFAIGVRQNVMTRGSVVHSSTFSTAAANELQITYTSGSPPAVPSQVTGLTATAVGTDEIDLSWSTPAANGSTITGYHVKYECPTGSVFQDLVTDTGTTSTTLKHVGLSPGTECNYKVAAINGIGTGAYSDPASATTSSSACDNFPDEVDDLATYTITNNRIGLSWTEPNLYGCSIDGYQINYTTPYSSNPATIIQPNTGSSQINYLVNGLTKDTQYSFRVGTITGGGLNATGNVVNATTTNLGVPDLFAGGLNFTATNTDVVQITFEQQAINATDILVNVTYPDTYNMTCNLAFKYAMNDQNYSNIDYVTLSGNKRESSFALHNFTNEIIYFRCVDENTGDLGKYIVTQSNFMYLQLVQGFQSGEFGTMGQFGTIDLVTLLVVIAAMVGLNSVNETVAGIFIIAILGALWYFNIISLYTIMMASLTLVILLIITTTKKD